MNKVILSGNVGKDPETRMVNETKVSRFSLATQKGYKQQDGSYKNVTTWHNIVAWRRLAEYIEKYVRKGTKILVEGEIRDREWIDKNNQKHYEKDIVIDSIEIFEKKAESAPVSLPDDLPF